MLLLSLTSDLNQNIKNDISPKLSPLIDMTTVKQINKQNITVDYHSPISKIDNNPSNLLLNYSTRGIEQVMNFKPTNYFSKKILKQNENNDKSDLDNTVIINPEKTGLNLALDETFNNSNENMINITNNDDGIKKNIDDNNEYIITDESSDLERDMYDLEKLSKEELNALIGKFNQKNHQMTKEWNEIQKSKEVLKKEFEGIYNIIA